MTKEELKQEVEEYKKELKSKFFLSEPQLGLSCEGYKDGLKKQEKHIKELEQENERIKTKYYELQDTLKKVRLALIKERTANIMNYGKGGVEMFDDLMEILKGNGEI